MKSYRLLFPLFLLASLLLGACSPPEAGKTAVPVKRELSLAAIATEAKGFTVGALMSNHTVYVFFDTQCPHCGHLWQASEALQSKVKFVWIPVRMINATSAAQGAALLTAVNPGALMSEHEVSLLAGKGGIAASSSVPSEIEQAMQKNTALLNSFGAESVPFLVARNLKTGQTVSRNGALSSAALSDFLGLDLP